MVPDGELPANKYGAYSKLFVLAHEAWKESEDDRPPVYGWSYANNNYSVNNNNNNYYNNKNLYKTRTPIRHDPNFNGPRPNRGCTDVIFLLLFICFLGAWGYVAYYGFQNGDPQRFLRATDSSGRKCGVDSEVLDKPYLFFFDLTACAKPQTLLSGCDTPQVCVKECPKASWNSLPYRNGLIQFDRSAQEMLICVNDQIKNQVTTAAKLDQKVKENECASWYIPSRPLQSRCLPSPEDIDVSQSFLQETGVPNAVTMLNNSTINMSAQQMVGKVIDDLYATWRPIVVILTIAILISLFYITLLRWIAGIVTWLSLLAVLALLITFSILSYQRYDYLKKNGPDEVNSSMIKGQLEELANKDWLFLTLTIVCGVIALILFLLIVFLRKRIQIAITLIKEGSKAVSNVISSLFFPIIPWCLQALILVWFIFIWMSLSSVGNQIFKARFQSSSDCICSGQYQSLTSQDVCDPQLFSQLCKSRDGGICKNAGCHFFRIDSPQIVTYFHVFNVFGIFWAIWFVIGMSDMILAGTFAKWYWTMDKRKVPFFAVTASAGRTVRYHLGTIAFGSLIIAICSFIRACIEYAEKKVKGYDNSVVKALFCCLKCFFWCLEKFLRFINKNAYIMCAIHGRNFCLSAKDAFNLLMRNMIRVVVLDKVTDFLFFIGKLVISGGMVVMAHFLFFNNMKHLTLNYNSTVPCVVIAIGSYIIASIFFGVYSMAVDTLFLCFLEDCERNDGSVEKPYFMSTNLMRILGKKNRKNK